MSYICPYSESFRCGNKTIYPNSDDRCEECNAKVVPAKTDEKSK